MDIILDKTSATTENKSQPSIVNVVLQREQGDTKFVDKSKPKVLEIVQVYGGSIQDSKHFQLGDKVVTIGSQTGNRLRFLGIPIAWVPGFFSVFGSLMYPFTDASLENKSDLYGPTPNDTPLDFIVWQGQDPYCNLPATWSAQKSSGNSFEVISDGSAATNFIIPEDTHVLVQGSGCTYILRRVHNSKKLVGGIGKQIDFPFIALLLMMFSGAVGLLYFVSTLDYTPPEVSTEELMERLTEIQVEEPPPEEEKKDANPDAGEGAKAKKEEGKVGKKESKMKEAKGDKVEISQKQKDKEIVENAGIMGALSDAGNIEGLGGNSGLDASLQGGLGGVIGAKGVQMGSGGLGGSGSGLGGGGSADGLGGLGNKGTGRGSSGYGTGGGSYGKKKSGGIGKIGGEPIILGSLDKSLIDAVIKNNMNQIKYCYSRELNKNPSLGGKIVIKFVIAKDGTVSKADVKSSSMGSPAVESCITSRFRKFKFPEPKGGGIVIVSYPFIFNPG